jgi:hypothetical protein
MQARYVDGERKALGSHGGGIMEVCIRKVKRGEIMVRIGVCLASIYASLKCQEAEYSSLVLLCAILLGSLVSE